MSQFSFDVGLADFQRFVIDNSFHAPVLVDFWADWCQPCRTLGPLLEKLAQEYQGAFLLAKINADREQALAAHLGVRSLPTVLVVRDGQIVETLTGAQPESAYRQVIDTYRARIADKVLEQAEAAWHEGRQDDALTLLREGLAQDPGDPDMKVSLAAKLVERESFLEAGKLLRSLPENLHKVEPVAGLLARVAAAEATPKSVDTSAFDKRLAINPDDHAVRLALAAALFEAGDYERAAEQYLEAFRRDRTFENGAARQGLFKLFETLGNEHPLVAVYRRRLASLLY